MRELTFDRLLERACDRDPDRVATIDADEIQTTFADHLRLTRALAGGLAARLSGPAATFGVLALNSAEYIRFWQAALLGGGVLVPLNTRLAVAELALIVNDAAVELLFVDTAFAAIGEKLRRRCPAVRLVIGMADAALPETTGALVAERRHVTRACAEDDPVMIMYTGGTTGRPKGVVHTQRSIVLGVHRQFFLYDIVARDSVTHLSAPLFHVAGFVGAVAVPAAGGTTVVSRTFEAETFIDQTARFGVSHTGLVPIMLARILDHPDYHPDKLRTLRQIAYGGAPMPMPLMARLRHDFPSIELLQTYGMTEANLLTVLDGADHRRAGNRLNAVGRPLPGVELSVRGEDDAILPRGAIGEICVRAGSVMLGYHGQPELTAERLRGGWYHTGDMGYRDERGYLFLVDRRDDMIISGGENIYSVEVEAAIASHPAVAMVAVIGVPHPAWGEAVHAVVVLQPGESATAEDLVSHARASLAGYKCPKTVAFRTEMPLSPANKIYKKALRDDVAGEAICMGDVAKSTPAGAPPPAARGRY